MRTHGQHPCGWTGCKFVALTAQGRGAHRHAAHGVTSTHPKTVEYRKKYYGPMAGKRKVGRPRKVDVTQDLPVPVRYCPGCGTHIAAVILAMQLSGK